MYAEKLPQGPFSRRLSFIHRENTRIEGSDVRRFIVQPFLMLPCLSSQFMGKLYTLALKSNARRLTPEGKLLRGRPLGNWGGWRHSLSLIGRSSWEKLANQKLSSNCCLCTQHLLSATGEKIWDIAPDIKCMCPGIWRHRHGLSSEASRRVTEAHAAQPYEATTWSRGSDSGTARPQAPQQATRPVSAGGYENWEIRHVRLNEKAPDI